jgi:predicted permease
LQDHIERRTAELIAGGLTVAAAREQAERAFGDLNTLSAECRDITTKARRSPRRVERLDGLMQDLRFAIRLLRRSPTFAMVAIATLALGVGANSAIFSLIDSVLLRPLPYDHSAQLADVVELHKKGWAHPSYANFVDLRAQSHTFRSLAGYYSGPTTILGGDQPMRVDAGWVTADFFRTLRVRPEVGRLTTAADHQPGAIPVAVVSDRFWRNHLAANPDLSSLHLRGEFNLQVVGVFMLGFDFPGDVDVWQPLELQEQSRSRTSHGLSVTGRLHDGVTPGAAQHELDLIMQRVGQTAGLDFDAVGTKVTSLQDDLTGAARKPLLLLLAASALLLLTACTNLASTLLARGTARAQELAVRTAIGAGRLRLVRQIVTESLVIAVAGCTV